jgi:hypothetical protein
VQTERPAIRCESHHHPFQLVLQRCCEVGPRLKEVLEVGRGEDEHFARAIHAKEGIAIAGLGHLHPAGEVLLLLLRLLGEEIVGDADGEFSAIMKLTDDLVVLRIVLETTTGIDATRHAEAVQLAHEMAARIELMLRRELRSLGQRRVEDHRIRPCNEQAGGIAILVALDFPAGRIGRVLGVTAGA